MGASLCACDDGEVVQAQEPISDSTALLEANSNVYEAAYDPGHKEEQGKTSVKIVVEEGPKSPQRETTAGSIDGDKKKHVKLGLGANEEGEGEAGEARKKEFRAMSANSASFRKCPTFIDPNRGLRNMKSVAVMEGNVLEGYEMMDKLGEGGFGTVFKAKHKESGKLFALKSIPVENVGDPDVFERELDIARKLNHPYIIKLHETYNDLGAYHLVMDLCVGGDFHDHIVRTCITFGGQQRGGLQSADVGKYGWMILNGLAYMHNYRFAHRDIKPENYLMVNHQANSIKLIDFGLGRSFKKGEKMTSKVGTIAYVAPEVMNAEDGYTEKCDLWSVGVLFFVMCSAELPFMGSDDQDTLKKVKEGKPLYANPEWNRHPQPLKDIVKELLTLNPDDRPSASQLLMNNAWIQKYQAGKKAEGCCSLQ